MNCFTMFDLPGSSGCGSVDLLDVLLHFGIQPYPCQGGLPLAKVLHGTTKGLVQAYFLRLPVVSSPLRVLLPK